MFAKSVLRRYRIVVPDVKNQTLIAPALINGFPQWQIATVIGNCQMDCMIEFAAGDYPLWISVWFNCEA